MDITNTLISEVNLLIFPKNALIFPKRSIHLSTNWFNMLSLTSYFPFSLFKLKNCTIVFRTLLLSLCNWNMTSSLLWCLCLFDVYFCTTFLFFPDKFFNSIIVSAWSDHSTWINKVTIVGNVSLINSHLQIPTHRAFQFHETPDLFKKSGRSFQKNSFLRQPNWNYTTRKPIHLLKTVDYVWSFFFHWDCPDTIN